MSEESIRTLRMLYEALMHEVEGLQSNFLYGFTALALAGSASAIGYCLTAKDTKDIQTRIRRGLASPIGIIAAWALLTIGPLLVEVICVEVIGIGYRKLLLERELARAHPDITATSFPEHYMFCCETQAIPWIVRFSNDLLRPELTRQNLYHRNAPGVLAVPLISTMAFLVLAGWSRYQPGKHFKDNALRLFVVVILAIGSLATQVIVVRLYAC